VFIPLSQVTVTPLSGVLSKYFTWPDIEYFNGTASKSVKVVEAVITPDDNGELITFQPAFVAVILYAWPTSAVKVYLPVASVKVTADGLPFTSIWTPCKPLEVPFIFT